MSIQFVYFLNIYPFKLIHHLRRLANGLKLEICWQMVNQQVNFLKTAIDILISSAQFTVFGYNVLSGPYATTSLYHYCPNWALNWEYRKNTIIKEITFYDSDIVALQVCL